MAAIALPATGHERMDWFVLSLCFTKGLLLIFLLHGSGVIEGPAAHFIGIKCPQDALLGTERSQDSRQLPCGVEKSLAKRPGVGAGRL